MGIKVFPPILVADPDAELLLCGSPSKREGVAIHHMNQRGQQIPLCLQLFSLNAGGAQTWGKGRFWLLGFSICFRINSSLMGNFPLTETLSSWFVRLAAALIHSRTQCQRNLNLASELASASLQVSEQVDHIQPFDLHAQRQSFARAKVEMEFYRLLVRNCGPYTSHNPPPLHLGFVEPLPRRTHVLCTGRHKCSAIVGQANHCHAASWCYLQQIGELRQPGYQLRHSPD